MSTPANQIGTGFSWDNVTGFKRSYDPFVAAASEYEEPEGIQFSDYAKSVMGGGANLVQSSGWLAKQLGAENIGSSIEKLGNNAVDFWHDSLSDAAKAEVGKEIIRKNDVGEYEWGDASFSTVGLMGAESLLGTAAGMGIGASLTKVLQVFANPFGRKALQTAVEAGSPTAARKLKLVDTVLGATGFGAGEGAVGGISAGASVYDNVMRLPHEKMMANPRYSQVYDSTDNRMSELERHQYAADTVAKEASSSAGWQAGLTTALLGAPMGAYFGRILGGAKLSSTLPRAIATGAGGEAAQEFAQSGAEQIISNLARQPFEPDLDTFEGALNAAVSGALAGGLLGGAVGPSAVKGSKGELAAEDEVKQRKSAERIGGELKSAATAAANAGVSKKALLEITNEATSGKVEAGAAIIKIRELMQSARTGEPIVEEPPKVEKKEKKNIVEPARNADTIKLELGGLADDLDMLDRGEPPARYGSNFEATAEEEVPALIEIAKQDIKKQITELRTELDTVQKLKPTDTKIQPVAPTPKPSEETSSQLPQEVKAATALIATRPRGDTQRSVAGDIPVNTQFQLVEANEMLASHTPAGEPVQTYPQFLQPRDRSLSASRQQIQENIENFQPERITQGDSLATGAPLISPEGVVESGNGRAIMMNQIYQSNPQAAAQYRDYLNENAESFGLTPEQVGGLKNPVLVRTRQDQLSEQQLIDVTQAANLPSSTPQIAETEEAVIPDESVQQALLSRKPIKDITLSREFEIEETGEVVKVEQNAEVMVRQLGKRMNVISELRGCVGG